MANVFTSGLNAMAAAFAGNASQTVTYRRGSKSVSLAATKAPVRPQQDQEFGILDINECDWIIKASLLVLSGTAIQPDRDDEIVEADGQRWHVLPTTGEPAYRPSDPFGNMYRVHTKRIEA